LRRPHSSKAITRPSPSAASSARTRSTCAPGSDRTAGMSDHGAERARLPACLQDALPGGVRVARLVRLGRGPRGAGHRRRVAALEGGRQSSEQPPHLGKSVVARVCGHARPGEASDDAQPRQARQSAQDLCLTRGENHRPRIHQRVDRALGGEAQPRFLLRREAPPEGARHCPERAQHVRSRLTGPAAGRRRAPDREPTAPAGRSHRAEDEARGRQQQARKAAKSTAGGASRGASRAGFEAKTVAEFREALRKNLIGPMEMVLLTRDRIEEVLSEAVERGRMTSTDAQSVASGLLDRGRKQTNEVLKDLESLLDKGRSGLGGRTSGARKAAGGAFHEVYIEAPLELCEQRDPKGLYRRARTGEIPEFTGVSSPYEAPESAELVVRTDQLSIEECLSELTAYVERAFAPEGLA